MSTKAIELALRTDVPILLLGEPGIGKTKAVEGIAREQNRPLVTVLASIREPSDFSGLPVVTKDGGVKLAAPMWADELGENGILFLDEMNTAPPAVQAALLRVALDKVVGEKRLSRGVRVVAAINPQEYAANGFDLAPPLANRFMHISFQLKPDEWANNFPEYWGFPPVITGVDPQTWGEKRGLIAAFISTRPTMLLQFPKEESRRCGAWASPRTWDFASRVLAVSSDPDDILLGFTGTIGEGAAMEFNTWLRNLDLPNPEDVIKNCKKFEVPKRADKVFAILSGVISAIKNKPDEARWTAGWTVIGKVIDAGFPDVSAMWARSLVALNFQNNEKKYNFEFPDELKKFLPIFRAAKIRVNG